jgi:hypothetical protein
MLAAAGRRGTPRAAALCGGQRQSRHHRTERQQRPYRDHDPANASWKAVERRKQKAAHSAEATRRTIR